MADGGLSLLVHTQELTPENEAEVMRLKRQLGYFVFAVSGKITDEDIPTEKLDASEDKTPSQRQRAVLYRLWEQNKAGYNTFESYYRAKMEQHITQLKEKLI